MKEKITHKLKYIKNYIMKKLLFILATILITTSCSNKYEKAIANYVQTDNKMQVKLDLNFKAKSIKEIKDITVADSMQIIQDDIFPIIDKRIEGYKELLQEAIETYTTDSLKHMQGIYSEIYRETYNERNRGKVEAGEKRVQKAIDFKEEYNNLYNLYKGRDGKEKLLIVVECTYTIKDLKYLGVVETEKNDAFLIFPKSNVVKGSYYANHLLFDVKFKDL